MPPGASVIQGHFPRGLGHVAASASPHSAAPDWVRRAVQQHAPAPVTQRKAAPQPLPSATPNGTALRLPPNVAPFPPGGGQPLPPAVRQRMELALGASFADVRIHVGPQAAAIGATSFTHGSQIHFAPGHYAPSTVQGRKVLAHELVHVIQQRTGKVRNPFGAGVAIVHDRTLEAEADRIAHRLTMMPAYAHVARAPFVQPHVAQATLRGFLGGMAIGGGIVGLGALTMGASLVVGGVATGAASLVSGVVGYFATEPPARPVRAQHFADNVVEEEQHEEFGYEAVDLNDVEDEVKEDDAEEDDLSLEDLMRGTGIAIRPAKPKKKKAPAAAVVAPYATRKRRALSAIQGEVERCARDPRYHYNLFHTAFTIGNGPFTTAQKADIRNGIRGKLSTWVSASGATSSNVLHGKVGKGNNFNVGAWTGRGMVLNLHFLW